MRRREFISLLGGAAAWPLAARAQQQAKLPTIGFLGPTKAAIATDRITAFAGRLNELGWRDRQTVMVDYRWADGKAERFKEIAADFVRQPVDVIVTWGTATALAAKHATSVIPIVFTIVSDPVGTGLAASLRSPGGNATGLSTEQADIAGKRLELLREIVPGLSRLALLANPSNPGTLREMREAQAAAQTLGLQVVVLQADRVDQIRVAVEAAHNQAQALFVSSDAFLNNNRRLINASAIDARLPTIYGYREAIGDGGLLSYGPSYTDLFRGAADYVDKILRGTKPSDLPIEQPTKFELVVNRKTAEALGLDLPQTLIARADEVID
jgi:putative tryptophan/tyrosine transport system substrate-binding protein